MIKPKVGDTLVYKSEADKAAFIDELDHNKRIHSAYYNDGYVCGEVGVNGNIRTQYNSEITVCEDEYKYFKIKEKEMLKPDDIINVEMKALDGYRLLGSLDRFRGTGYIYHALLISLGVDNSNFTDELEIDDIRNWSDNSKLTLAALAQFKNPKQDKIDELEKRINDAAAELAKLKGE